MTYVALRLIMIATNAAAGNKWRIRMYLIVVRELGS